MLSHAEWESARVVYEDLEYLAEEWTPVFDEPALRRISPMLRRLLVEGQYPSAWTSLGLPDEPYVSATDLGAALGSVPREFLQYALAPPATEVGLLMASALSSGDVEVRYQTIEEVPAGSVIALPAEYPHRFGFALIVIPADAVAEVGGEEAARQRYTELGRRKFEGSLYRSTSSRQRR